MVIDTSTVHQSLNEKNVKNSVRFIDKSMAFDYEKNAYHIVSQKLAPK